MASRAAVARRRRDSGIRVVVAMPPCARRARRARSRHQILEGARRHLSLSLVAGRGAVRPAHSQVQRVTMRVLSIIETLMHGGAETVLVDLVSRLNEHEHR